MDRVNKVKKWVKKQLKNKKFVITTIVFLVLLVAVVFGFTISFSGILGSAYDVDSIGKNIDKIKIGDTINYTANGYSDWEVLNINKEDNTIDIVSKTSVENVTISGYDDFTNYYDILQNTANKYLDGKYAISARSITKNDLNSLKVMDTFWIPAKSIEERALHFNSGLKKIELDPASLLPIVTIAVLDSSNFNVGDLYTYSLNGIDEWYILCKDSLTTISIIPKTPELLDFFYGCPNPSAYIDEKLSNYKADKVISVRSVTAEDIDLLENINYDYAGIPDFYTGILSNDNENFIYVYYRQWDNRWGSYSGNPCEEYGKTSGFRPVVTIKYGENKESGKDIDKEIKIGDSVKYSTNAYNNWKVLNIDKEKGTVDIISSGIVKNITLNGKEDYDNLEKILQSEVDKYKVGDNVINVRSVQVNDLDNLKIMKDTLSAKYFLNNKKNYRMKEAVSYNSGVVNVSLMAYGVAIGYYDRNISSLNYEWSNLEYEYAEPSYVLSLPTVGSFSYTAGLRPIITLKLSEVEEVDDNDATTDNDNKLVAEQNKANQSSQVLVPNEKVEKDNFVSEDESEDFVLDLAETVKELNSNLKKHEEKSKKIVIFLVVNFILTVGIGIFSVFSKFGK